MPPTLAPMHLVALDPTPGNYFPSDPTMPWGNPPTTARGNLQAMYAP